jgi:hypothetical protein
LANYSRAGIKSLRGTGRDSIMPCAVNPVLKLVYRSPSLDRSIISTYISLLTKTGFPASNRRSLLSEFVLRLEREEVA